MTTAMGRDWWEVGAGLCAEVALIDELKKNTLALLPATMWAGDSIKSSGAGMQQQQQQLQPPPG